MASMRLWVLASVVFSIVTLPVGCSSSEKSPGGSGGSGGSAGADSGSGNGGTSGSGGAAGASCHGDKTKWAAATGTISLLQELRLLRGDQQLRQRGAGRVEAGLR